MFKVRFLLLGLILVANNAYARTFPAPNISADAAVTALNTTVSQIADVINGEIEGSSNGTSVVNIKADSVYEINMADDANGRVRDSELFNITTDSVSGGTLTQGAVVESGCVPADSAGLTSDISACVAYVNGYRVSKGATSQTYTASRDTYVDLSQTGVYTLSAVSNGAAQPNVAANSVRLAKVVTDGTEITTVTSLYTTRVPGLIIPGNYRDQLNISKDSATVINVFPGSVEINNTIVSKTATTSLTISTAGDWAGGTSLRAADTFAFVGIDASGNLKLHTTAPSHSNYAVSVTAGKKRYATWSGTVYRALGWFYMDGAQNVENASNIREYGLSNIIQSNDTAIVSVTGTTLTERQKMKFYNSGGQIKLYHVMSMDAGVTDGLVTELYRDSVLIPGAGNVSASSNAGALTGIASFFVDMNRPQATATYSVYSKMNSGTVNVNRRALIIEEA